MDTPAALIPLWLNIVSGLLLVSVLVFAGVKQDWKRLLNNSQQHVLFGSIVLVSFFWQLQANIRPGLALHLLGATLVTRMLGGWLASFAMVAVLLVHTAVNTHHWQALPVNALLLALCPVGMASGLLWLQQRFLPKNLFIFLLGGGFIGAAIVFAATGFFAVFLLSLIGAYPLDFLLSDYLPFWLLLSWGEAFQTGFLLTLMVVYKPEWVSSFNDLQYLGKKPRF